MLQILFATMLAASAHVTVEPKSTFSGGYTKLTFRVSHGCEGSPTKSITVRIPEGAISVKPQVHTGWKIKTKKVNLSPAVVLHGKEIKESVSEVTWFGGNLSDEYMDEFGIALKMPDRAGETLAFPVVQECKKGSLHWTDIPSKEIDSHEHDHHHGSSESPAPLVKLEPLSDSASHSTPQKN